jgi:hypothetical protein
MEEQKSQAKAQLLITKEAFEAFSSASSEIEGEVKGHFVSSTYVQIYVDLAFLTQLINMKKNEGGEWVATFEAGDSVEMQVRNERHRMAQDWIPLN